MSSRSLVAAPASSLLPQRHSARRPPSRSRSLSPRLGIKKVSRSGSWEIAPASTGHRGGGAIHNFFFAAKALRPSAPQEEQQMGERSAAAKKAKISKEDGTRGASPTPFTAARAFKNENTARDFVGRPAASTTFVAPVAAVAAATATTAAPFFFFRSPSSSPHLTALPNDSFKAASKDVAATVCWAPRESAGSTWRWCRPTNVPTTSSISTAMDLARSTVPPPSSLPIKAPSKKRIRSP